LWHDKARNYKGERKLVHKIIPPMQVKRTRGVKKYGEGLGKIKFLALKNSHSSFILKAREKF